MYSAGSLKRTLNPCPFFVNNYNPYHPKSTGQTTPRAGALAGRRSCLMSAPDEVRCPGGVSLERVADRLTERLEAGYCPPPRRHRRSRRRAEARL